MCNRDTHKFAARSVCHPEQGGMRLKIYLHRSLSLMVVVARARDPGTSSLLASLFPQTRLMRVSESFTKPHEIARVTVCEDSRHVKRHQNTKLIEGYNT